MKWDRVYVALAVKYGYTPMEIDRVPITAARALLKGDKPEGVAVSLTEVLRRAR